MCDAITAIPGVPPIPAGTTFYAPTAAARDGTQGSFFLYTVTNAAASLAFRYADATVGSSLAFKSLPVAASPPTKIHAMKLLTSGDGTRTLYVAGDYLDKYVIPTTAADVTGGSWARIAGIGGADSPYAIVPWRGVLVVGGFFTSAGGPAVVGTAYVTAMDVVTEAFSSLGGGLGQENKVKWVSLFRKYCW